jgi:MoaA/NifB/PqqE/SkfB family radical SAM enzyme
VESHDAETHDKIQLKPGSFERIIEGIEEVKRLRNGAPKPEIKIRAKTNRSNYVELGKYIDFWEKRSMIYRFSLFTNRPLTFLKYRKRWNFQKRIRENSQISGRIF